MKAILVILSFFIVFMVFFFLFSLIGLLWIPSYGQIISTPEWFACYTIALGWWIAGMAADEIYTQVYDI